VCVFQSDVVLMCVEVEVEKYISSSSRKRNMEVRYMTSKRKQSVFTCKYCGKPIPNWEELELELAGCRYYCSRKCCEEHYVACGGSLKDAPTCPCF